MTANNPDDWDNEYSEVKTIPGSTREAPAKFLLEMERLIDWQKVKTALDAACGNGRNAIWLSKKVPKVYALDFSKSAIEEVRRKIIVNKLENKVEAKCASLYERLPFDDNSIDFVLDSYASFDFPDVSKQQAYWKELQRVLTPNGYYVGGLFHVKDGYYNQFITTEESTPVVRDLTNNLCMRLYNGNDVQKLISDFFKPERFCTIGFKDIVRDKEFYRLIISFIARKK